MRLCNLSPQAVEHPTFLRRSEELDHHESLIEHVEQLTRDIDRSSADGTSACLPLRCGLVVPMCNSARERAQEPTMTALLQVLGQTGGRKRGAACRSKLAATCRHA